MGLHAIAGSACDEQRLPGRLDQLHAELGPLTAIAGFMLVGAGCAVMVPLAFSAGANLARSGTALSIVTGAGYAGSIVGPFLIGSTSDRVGLRAALAIPLAAALAVLVSAVSLRPPTAVSVVK